MANTLVTNFKRELLEADIDLLTETIKAILIDAADYTFSAAHDFLDDVAAGAREETATLGSKTTTAGAFDSADVTFTAAAGDPCEAVLVYDDTAGAESTDFLIGYWDTASSGLPVTLNGGDVVVAPHASGWFSL